MEKPLYRRLLWCGLPLIAGSLVLSALAVAQSYPSNMIRIVVGGPAGTPPDIITRIVANELGQGEGWRIVVENKPGAIYTIAAGEVLKQLADGYTVFAIALPASAAPALLPNIGVRLDTDFAPVIKLMTAHQVLVVNPSVPAKSLTELVALLKSQPDKFTFSSGGFGTPAHLTGELFKLQTGVRVAHVPYRALPQAIVDLLNGTNHYQFITPLPVLDLIAAGKLRPLAVTAPKRMPALKDVPTVVEEGFPDLIIQDWVGFLVKSGTPDDIVARLNEATNKALAKPSVREALAKIAAEPAGGSPAEFGALVKAQIAMWGKVVKDSGIKIRE
jgi:tripartite-type tricarboxylate transporter receptor subunit TctC